MNISRRIGSVIIFFCFACNLYPQQRFSGKEIKTRIINGDPAIFYNTYLAAKMEEWQKHFDLAGFSTDTLIITAYSADLILTANLPDGNIYSLVFKLDRSDQPVIYDIFRRITNTAEREMDSGGYIVDFVGHFLWNYDLDNQTFLLDFIYPDYIQLEYQDSHDKKYIINQLKILQPTMLDIKSIAWQKEAESLQLDLQIMNPLSVLSIKLNLNKYLAGRFFEEKDYHDRLVQLKDSLFQWNRQKTGSAKNSFKLKARNMRDAQDHFITTYLKSYSQNILNQSGSKLEIEIMPDQQYGHTPLAGRYLIKAIKSDQDLFMIEAQWIKDAENIKKITDHFLDIKIRELKVLGIIDTLIWQYSSLGLPDVMQNKVSNSIPVSWKINIPAGTEFSLAGEDNELYVALIRKLAKDMTANVFIRDLAYSDNSLRLKVFVILSDPDIYWQHLAIVNITYMSFNSDKMSNDILFEFYPYLRTENVKTLFSIKEKVSSDKKKIYLKRD